MIKLSKESDALHTALVLSTSDSADPGAVKFYQADLTKCINCSVEDLLIYVQELCDHGLLRPFKLQGQNHWQVRTKDLAASLSALNEEERMVFGHVENAGPEGIWVKKIKAITQMPPNEAQKAVGKLERLGIIKGIKSVKNPTQRTYMLSHLAPNSEVTGGSFFDAGELDDSLVEELCNLIIFHVRMESWIDQRHRRRGSSFVDLDDDATADSRKRKRAVESIEKDGGAANGDSHAIIDDDSDTAQPAKRRRQDQPAVNGKKRPMDMEDAHTKAKKKRRESEARLIQLAYPPGTKEYPTTESILQFLRGSEAIRDSKSMSLTSEEVQGLIDVLVWDDKLEQIRNGYRTVRGVEPKQVGAYEEVEEVAGNGLTEVPCSRCQLFDLCQEGTRVSAATCVYYDEWIKV